jgi:hypothetical protein
LAAWRAQSAWLLEVRQPSELPSFIHQLLIDDVVGPIRQIAFDVRESEFLNLRRH